MLFAAAGASDYGVGRFLTVVMICRSVRYAFIAIVADHYARHFVRVLRHPSQYWGLVTAVRGGHLQLDHGWNSAQSKTYGCKHWVKGCRPQFSASSDPLDSSRSWKLKRNST
jgi:hypothetical protein